MGSRALLVSRAPKVFPASSPCRAYSAISRVRHTPLRRLAPSRRRSAGRQDQRHERDADESEACQHERAERPRPLTRAPFGSRSRGARRPDHQAELETAKHRAARALVGAARPERVAAVERELEGPDENEREHEQASPHTRASAARACSCPRLRGPQAQVETRPPSQYAAVRRARLDEHDHRDDQPVAGEGAVGRVVQKRSGRVQRQDTRDPASSTSASTGSCRAAACSSASLRNARNTFWGS